MPADAPVMRAYAGVLSAMLIPGWRSNIDTAGHGVSSALRPGSGMCATLVQIGEDAVQQVAQVVVGIKVFAGKPFIILGTQDACVDRLAQLCAEDRVEFDIILTVKIFLESCQITGIDVAIVDRKR